MIQRILATEALAATVLIRVMIGGIFLSEVIQKFLYPAELAEGRFAKIDVPFPEIMGPFVGMVEIVSGTLLLIGLFTRLVAIPLIFAMLVAMLSIKIPILLGHGFWGCSAGTASLWSLEHAPRSGK